MQETLTKIKSFYIISITLLETPHVIVAAAIAYKVGNPALALPLALGSHFILEKVPHWNPHLNTEKKKFGKLTSQTIKIITLDTFLALSAGLFIASRVLPDIPRFIVIITACLLGVLPDLIEGPYFLMNKDSKFIRRWVTFQKSIQSDTAPVPGLTTQLLVILATFWWIFT